MKTVKVGVIGLGSRGECRLEALRSCPKRLAAVVTPSCVSFEDAVHGVAVADAFVKSCRTGQDMQL